ncbi:hypothetical protein FOA52_001679 [Chlamydomonas sp. UWO 241]|nr:hypothetical protein FOA52_001679 [Chlamydomonas sp. UWO 241]
MFRQLLTSALMRGISRSAVAATTTPLCLAAARAASTAASGGASGSSGAVNWAAVGSLALAGLASGAAWAQPAEASATAERSFIMIKPDGVQRGLIADIIQRFESKGYKLVGIKVVVPPKALAEAHYEEHAERPFFPKLVTFLSSGAVVAMVWEGKEAIKYGRTMIGATNPLASAPGTIRGDFAIDMGRNIIHGSDSVSAAQREIALWFKPEELASYEPATKAWIYE